MARIGRIYADRPECQNPEAAPRLQDGQELICSANGHAFGVTESPRIRGLFERVNSGELLEVSSLIAEFAGTAVVGKVGVRTTGEDVRRVLERVVALRALAVTA